MLFAQFQIVTNKSMASSVTSSIVRLPQDFGYAVQANYATSGTLGGVLELQASVDHEEDTQGNVLRAGTFVRIANSNVTITGAGNYVWNITSSNYPYFRLLYTPAMSDTGTLNAYCTVKGI